MLLHSQLRTQGNGEKYDGARPLPSELVCAPSQTLLGPIMWGVLGGAFCCALTFIGKPDARSRGLSQPSYSAQPDPTLVPPPKSNKHLLGKPAEEAHFPPMAQGFTTRVPALTALGAKDSSDRRRARPKACDPQGAGLIVVSQGPQESHPLATIPAPAGSVGSDLGIRSKPPLRSTG